MAFIIDAFTFFGVSPAMGKPPIMSGISRSDRQTSVNKIAYWTINSPKHVPRGHVSGNFAAGSPSCVGRRGRVSTAPQHALTSVGNQAEEHLMRCIDAFNHFFPKRLWDRMTVSEGAARGISMRMRAVPAIYDLDVRFRIIDMFPDYSQILSLGMPPLDAMGPPELAVEYARLSNDGMAELVQTYPGRF